MRLSLLPILLFAACKDGEITLDDSAATDDSQAAGDDSAADSPADSPAPPDGEALYAEHCSECHGADARGTNKAPDLEREMRLTDAQIIGVILKGKEKMPAVEVTEEEAQAIVDYLRSILQ